MSVRLGNVIVAGSPSAVDESNLVHLDGNETVSGTKTFSDSPKVPTLSAGDNSTKVANTAYVDTTTTAAVNNMENTIMAKFQVVTALPGTVSEDTFYFIKES